MIDPSLKELMPVPSDHKLYDASINPVAAYTHGYLKLLYLPTLTRFGPMVIGLLTAFVMPTTPPPSSYSPGVLAAVCRTLVCAWAVGATPLILRVLSRK